MPCSLSDVIGSDIRYTLDQDWVGPAEKLVGIMSYEGGAGPNA